MHTSLLGKLVFCPRLYFLIKNFNKNNLPSIWCTFAIKSYSLFFKLLACFTNKYFDNTYDFRVKFCDIQNFQYFTIFIKHNSIVLVLDGLEMQMKTCQIKKQETKDRMLFLYIFTQTIFQP